MIIIIMVIIIIIMITIIITILMISLFEGILHLMCVPTHFLIYILLYVPLAMIFEGM